MIILSANMKIHYKIMKHVNDVNYGSTAQQNRPEQVGDQN